MNKQEMIDAIANDTNLSKVDAKKALEAFINNTSRALANKERVRLVGFGSFKVVSRAARPGRNPQTGATINIPAKNVVKFSTSSKLKV